MALLGVIQNKPKKKRKGQQKRNKSQKSLQKRVIHYTHMSEKRVLQKIWGLRLHSQ